VFGVSEQLQPSIGSLMVEVRTVEVRACLDRPLYLIIFSTRDLQQIAMRGVVCLVFVCSARRSSARAIEGAVPPKSALCRGAVVLRKFWGDLMGMGPSHGSA
jgi:hypothetical protein